MAAISLSLAHGVAGLTMSDFTVGTSAPGTGDFELRWNTTDTNSKNILLSEVFLALEAFERALLQGGATVQISTLSGGTPPPPSV